MGLVVQHYMCVTWVNLPPSFSPLIRFFSPSNGIRVLYAPFDFPSFTFLDLLDDDVQCMEALSNLWDVHVVFGIFFQCFVQRPSYLMHS